LKGDGAVLIFVSSSVARFSGTVIGVEEADPKKWPRSKWRCLKVAAYL